MQQLDAYVFMKYVNLIIQRCGFNIFINKLNNIFVSYYWLSMYDK